MHVRALFYMLIKCQDDGGVSFVISVQLALETEKTWLQCECERLNGLSKYQSFMAGFYH